MYASFFNQSYQLAHYLLSFLIVGFLAPLFLFSKQFENRSDQIVSNYTRIVFYLIIFGYGLVLTKLF
ncbi:MAG: hypothetical protein Q8898_14605, partial [Bacillota bacterium]|nr:hypothetical protein [Bacillota bacterium]